MKNGKVVAVCPKCGYIKETSTMSTGERYRAVEKVRIIGEEESKLSPMPTINIECPKCSYTQAYSWAVQTRSGDESETQFFKCKKCGYVWRLYT